MRSITRLASVAIVGALLLSACGSKSSSPSDTTPKNGGVLREGLVTLGSSDPAKAQTVSERQMADQLYDSLTAWSPTGFQAIPAIAASWSSTTDQKHWTFKLRPDAKAANGEQVTATDVKLSLQHVAKKATGSPSTDLLSIVTGFNAFSGSATATDLSGIVVTDPTTVQINLDSAFADLPLLLGNPTFGIVHYSGTTTYSTGPFMISQTPDATHLILAKAPGSAAHLDTVNVTYYTDVDTSYKAFQANQEDWTPVSPTNAAAAGTAYGTQLFRTSLRTLYLTFNTSNVALNNLQFRQAIVQAIDRNAVAKDLGPTASVLNGIVPDGIPGGTGAGCGAACSYNVDHAKTLIAAAFPNGAVPPVLTITAPTGDPLTDTAAAKIVADLAAVGVTATINRLTTVQFNSYTVDPGREIFQTSWSAAYPSAGAFLSPLFQSGATSNVSTLTDQKTDSDLLAAATQANLASRQTAFQRVETDVLAQFPVIPLATYPVDSVESARSRGIDPLPTGNFDVARSWVTGAVTPTPQS